MTEKPETIQSIWTEMMRIAHYFINQTSKASNSLESTCDLTLAQLKLLGVLADHYPEPMMVKEIAAVLGQTPGAVSQMLDTLCHQDVLERNIVESDRRSVAVSLSATGRLQLEQFLDHVSAKILVCLQDIPKERLETFLDVLHTLYARTFLQQMHMDN